MFDNLIIHTRELPDLDGREREILGAYHDWQTKDFQNELRVYVVDDNKKLFAQFSPYGDQHDLKKFGPSQFTGMVRFYSIVNVGHDPDHDPIERWIEFHGYFDEGTLTNIKRVRKARA